MELHQGQSMSTYRNKNLSGCVSDSSLSYRSHPTKRLGGLTHPASARVVSFLSLFLSLYICLLPCHPTLQPSSPPEPIHPRCSAHPALHFFTRQDTVHPLLYYYPAAPCTALPGPAALLLSRRSTRSPLFATLPLFWYVNLSHSSHNKYTYSSESHPLCL